ncbi:DNA (cytosine-5-)-methyltransferase [Aeromonas sp. SG16]|uniref:DNA (cytosine-5-)-methyltransferase n=1 Tax=Aeromonas sp. SG16 TaxID=2950548 RepID=UPI00210B0D1B|nr:DNA (cytosine-5-)-methyltransferase [Aeromonas sp. SG16]MCQ4052331.1 DNA (cytosine-5-)-methyltransferase [Aeromonas sp. SG16]
MIYGSVCSGIEAASLAWEPLGWNPAWFAEIEPFPSAVLAHHWPHVTNLGDMTKIATSVLKGDVVAPDILVGGTPCQAFSVAGAREGLADYRGFLTIKYVELANAIDQKRAAAGAVPCITVWENVPGVLSSKDNAFGAFLGFLAGEDCELVPPGKKWENAGCVLGPQRAIAWRILDAQYFGVAQRRRRVFVVASAREGFDPAKVLFECEGVRRDSAPSREAGKAVAALTANGVGTCGADDNHGQAGHLIAQHLDVDCIGTLTAGFGKVGAPEVDAYTCIPWASHVAETLNANGKAAGSATQQDAEAGLLVVHGTQDPDTNVELAHTLGRNQGQENAVLAKYNSIKGHDQRVIFAANNWDELVPIAFSSKDYCGDATENMSPTLRAGGHAGSHANAGAPPAIATAMAVRRLTPVECERLQGFPDGHTDVPYRGKPAADGPRYKAIGNSMAVPCMAFIGKRIDQHMSEIDLPAVDEEAA